MLLLEAATVGPVRPNVVNGYWPMQQVAKSKSGSVELATTFSHWAVDVEHWLTIWAISTILRLSLLLGFLRLRICIWRKVSRASWAISCSLFISSSAWFHSIEFPHWKGRFSLLLWWCTNESLRLLNIFYIGQVILLLLLVLFLLWLSLRLLILVMLLLFVLLIVLLI